MGWGKRWDPKNDSKRDLVILVIGVSTASTSEEGDEVDDGQASARAAITLHDRYIHVTQPWGTLTAQISGHGDVSTTSSMALDRAYGVTTNQVRTHHGGGSGVPTGPGFVAALIENTHPDVVLALGVRPEEAGFCIDDQAYNVVRPGIRDYRNRTGYVLAHESPKIQVRETDGSAFLGFQHDGTEKVTLASTLPVSEMRVAIERKGIRCRIVDDPGTGSKSALMSQVLDEIHAPRNGMRLLRAGYLTLPAVPGPWGFRQDTVNDCIYAALETIVSSISPDEYRLSGGEARAERYPNIYS